MAGPANGAFHGLASKHIPITTWLPAYPRVNLAPDALAAVSVWALLVPEAMAYATIAGVPLEAGLYASIMPLFMYAILGTCRNLFVGVDSSLAVLSASTVGAVTTDADEFFVLTSTLALIVGALLVLAGVARLGWISNFMAKPVLDGFIIGLALVVAVGQVAKMLGVSVDGDNFWENGWELLSHLNDSQFETALIGVGSLVALFAIRRFVPLAPGALMVVISGILLSAAFDLEDEGVAIVGDIPAGLPNLGWPDGFGAGQGIDLLPGALGIVLVAYAQSYAVARSYASRYGYPINPNQELIALGVSNIGNGLSQGFAVDGSLTKTAAADAAGQRTQMSSLIIGVLVVVTAMALTGMFHDLPEAVLAAIVFHAVWNLIDFAKLRAIWRVRRAEFFVAIACVLGVLTFDVLAGLIVAVLLSLLDMVYRVSHPRMPELGRASGGRGLYQSRDFHPATETFPGLVILRLDGDLFFANATRFADRVKEFDDREPGVRVVLLDAEGMTAIDVTAATELRDVLKEADRNGLQLWFAGVQDEVRQRLSNAGLEEAIGPERFYPTLDMAVAAFLAEPAPEPSEPA